MQGSLYKDISNGNGDNNDDENDDHNDDKDKYNGEFRCHRTVMTGTPQATRTNTGMFDPVTGDMRNGRGRYDFHAGIGYRTIEDEKRTDNNDAAWTAQASASVSTSNATSGGERGGNNNDEKDEKRKIRRDQED